MFWAIIEITHVIYQEYLKLNQNDWSHKDNKYVKKKLAISLIIGHSDKKSRKTLLVMIDWKDQLKIDCIYKGKVTLKILYPSRE